MSSDAEAAKRLLQLLLHGGEISVGNCMLRANPAITRVLHAVMGPNTLPFELVPEVGERIPLSTAAAMAHVGQTGDAAGFPGFKRVGKRLYRISTITEHTEAHGTKCYVGTDGPDNVCAGCGGPIA